MSDKMAFQFSLANVVQFFRRERCASSSIAFSTGFAHEHLDEFLPQLEAFVRDNGFPGDEFGFGEEAGYWLDGIPGMKEKITELLEKPPTQEEIARWEAFRQKFGNSFSVQIWKLRAGKKQLPT